MSLSADHHHEERLKKPIEAPTLPGDESLMATVAGAAGLRNLAMSAVELIRFLRPTIVQALLPKAAAPSKFFQEADSDEGAKSSMLNRRGEAELLG